MADNKALMISDEFKTMVEVSLALFESQYFSKEVKNKAQALVKVMAGAEVGIPPFASMSGIYIVNGKPTLGSNLVATLVKNDARYDYKVRTNNNTECSIAWFENSAPVGISGFTIEEARTAGLATKDVWQKYPSDMLFARALTRGARRFAPGIFGGTVVYTPEEVGADVEGPYGRIIEGESLPARISTSMGGEPLTPKEAGDDSAEISVGGWIGEAADQAATSSADTITEEDIKAAALEIGADVIERDPVGTPRTPAAFLTHAVETIERYDHPNAVKGALGLLGYEGVKQNDDDRALQYLHLTLYANGRDAGLDQRQAIEYAVKHEEAT